MGLTSEIIHGFQGAVLSGGYDNPQPTPNFHKELWEMACSEDPLIAVAAPRGHAKSTAVTHAYVLAAVLFREADFVVIVSNTEGQSKQFLGDIKEELLNNENLRELFGVQKLLKDSETEIICQTKDRHRFKILAKGSGQKVRGTKWLGKRPDLVVCDDMEDDETVLNPERRAKFRDWFQDALLPMGSDYCKFRLVGTVMHMDSLLERLLTDTAWVTKRYEAHNEDFSKVLWPEKFPRKRLERIRQGYINQGNAEGYYQEYLNQPIDPANAYFRSGDLLKIEDEDRNVPLNYYAAADFAISQKETADRSVLVVGGVDALNRLHIVHLVHGRWDGKEIVDEIMAVQERYEPEIFSMEAGMIERSLGAFLEEAQMRSGMYINQNLVQATKDKVSRARSIQARMRAGTVLFDHEAEWFPELRDEMLTFPRGKHDDMVDALAWLGHTVNKFATAPTSEEMLELEWEEEMMEAGEDYEGMNGTTGY